MKAKKVPIVLGMEYLKWIYDYDFFKSLSREDSRMFFDMLINGTKPIAKEVKTLGDVVDRFNLLPKQYVENEDEVLAAYPDIFNEDEEILGMVEAKYEKIPIIWKL